MILLKIDKRGELECNFGEIMAMASMYDRGEIDQETYNCKLIKLIWEAGWESAMRSMEASLYRPHLFEVGHA